MKNTRILFFLILASLVVVMPTSAAASYEIITNGTFDSNYVPWSPSAEGGSLGCDVSEGHDALGAMTIDADGDNQGGFVYPCYNVPMGWPADGGWLRVLLEGWYTSEDIEYLQYGIHFYTADDCAGTDLGYYFAQDTNPTQSAWTYFSTLIAMPVSTQSLQIEFAVETDGSQATEYVWFDDLSAHSAYANAVGLSTLVTRSNVLVMATLAVGAVCTGVFILRKK
ncbi:MAG: hypothetical protein P1S60_07605 [Anaerolineae bacterium]|nr:hypothetical protein [Anaerolineae bacterium]